MPSAIQLAWGSAAGSPRIGVLLEGIEEGVAAQAEVAAALLPDAVVRDGADPSGAWRSWTLPPPTPTEVELRISHLPSQLAGTLELVRHSVAGLSWRVEGRVGNGILLLRTDGSDTDRLAALVEGLRSGLRVGTVVVTAAPPALKRRVDVWGPVGDSLELMRRVKARFDPEGVLNAGRFVGGL